VYFDLSIVELPENVDALKALTLRQWRESEARNQRLDREKQQGEREIQRQISHLREQLNSLLASASAQREAIQWPLTHKNWSMHL
jgi:hypothetical protein